MKKSVILTSPLSIMSPIIKIVGNYCNLRCEYCFYHECDQRKKTVMNISLLEKFIREYLEIFKGNLRFTWHGGEPLLAGIKFFEKIVEFQDKYSKKNQNILNTIQTNGTLINDKWAQFFKKHDFRIGVSIDGIEECHDRFRKNKNGYGSFKNTIKGIKILQKYRVPSSVLSTITKQNLKYAKENFEFFVEDLGIKSIAYNYVYSLERKKYNVLPEDLAGYLKTIIDLWLKKNKPEIRIREIENYLAGIINRKASLCLFNGWCNSFFCLEFDGKIYPCDKLSGDNELLYGNLSDQHLIDILNSRKRIRYAQKVNYLPLNCMKCNWKDSCNNGCVYYRDKNNQFYFCQTRKDIFDYLNEKIGFYSDRKKKGGEKDANK